MRDARLEKGARRGSLELEGLFPSVARGVLSFYYRGDEMRKARRDNFKRTRNEKREISKLFHIGEKENWHPTGRSAAYLGELAQYE